MVVITQMKSSKSIKIKIIHDNLLFSQDFNPLKVFPKVYCKFNGLKINSRFYIYLKFKYHNIFFQFLYLNWLNHSHIKSFYIKSI